MTTDDGFFNRTTLMLPEICDRVVKEVGQVPEHFWYPGGRACGGPRFTWMDNRTMPPRIHDMILSLAPKAPTWHLEHMSVRRYLVGDSSFDFTEEHNYEVMVRIPLQTGPNGMLVQGVPYTDEAGVGVIIYTGGPRCEVPCVTLPRYELIYLYSEIEDGRESLH